MKAAIRRWEPRNRKELSEGLPRTPSSVHSKALVSDGDQFATKYGGGAARHAILSLPPLPHPSSPYSLSIPPLLISGRREVYSGATRRRPLNPRSGVGRGRATGSNAGGNPSPVCLWSWLASVELLISVFGVAAHSRAVYFNPCHGCLCSKLFCFDLFHFCTNLSTSSRNLSTAGI